MWNVCFRCVQVRASENERGDQRQREMERDTETEQGKGWGGRAGEKRGRQEFAGQAEDSGPCPPSTGRAPLALLRMLGPPRPILPLGPGWQVGRREARGRQA